MSKQYQQDWMAQWARYDEYRVAVKEFETDRAFTFGDFNRVGNRLAHHLTGYYGLKKGDRVAVLSDHCLEYVVLFCAAQKTGIILVPLNYRLSGAELDFMLSDADPVLIITEKKYQSLLEGSTAFASIARHWTIEDVVVFADPRQTAASDIAFEVAAVEEDDPIFILYTSGTTGFPKGALYTHKMLFWNSINTAMRLVINAETRTINVMPPFHTGGWNVLVTPLLHHGGYTCLMKKFDPTAVLELLQSERATLFMGVPTMLKMLAEEPGFSTASFPDLLYFIVGGEPMPIPLIEQWGNKGVAIRQGYGMTEVGPNLTSLHQDDAIRKKGSIGLPNFYVEIKIVDEQGRPTEQGQTGELLLKSPVVTPGYWRNENAYAQVMTDGWFHTGDVVRQDEDGYLFVVDRIKNMFISGGENVYPAEVERVLMTYPSVAEAAVIGIPDAKWGEVGKAFVALRPGMNATEVMLENHCKGHLARFKIPKSFHFVPALPKNDTGKIDRRALKR